MHNAMIYTYVQFEASYTYTSGFIHINVTKENKYGYHMKNTEDITQVINVHIHSTESSCVKK